VALQTFTAGQVLTAAQVTALQANDYNQTVNNYTDSRTLTIADLGDRVVMNKATATTITVNTGIFAAGDTLWIHNIGAGVCTITAGTATVSTSGSLALAQNAGGTLYFTSTGAAIFFPTVASSAQGLTLINTTSFSAVSSFSLNANTFTSTYDHYRIYLNITTASTTVGYNVRFRAAGSDSSASEYAFYSRHSSSSTGGDTNTQNRNQTSGVLFNTSITTDTQLYVIDVMSPKLSQITALFYQSTGAVGNHNYGTVVFQTTTSFDSLSVFPSTGTFTGNFSVYGLAK